MMLDALQLKMVLGAGREQFGKRPCGILSKGIENLVNAGTPTWPKSKQCCVPSLQHPGLTNETLKLHEITPVTNQ